MKLLSVVIPSYNSEDYLARCLDSLLIDDARLDVIIVNDGSKDKTQELAEWYAKKYSHYIRAVNQENKGHGGAVNTGLALAEGMFFKVLDSDDWFQTESLTYLLDQLEAIAEQDVDVVINNYVYERAGKSFNRTIHFHGVITPETVVRWEDIKNMPRGKYLMMHALVYRTALLSQIGLKLPEHTFYVDNLYVYLPLRQVETLYYVDVDLYRYFIGRDDQSVNEVNMIQRIDQQLKVNQLMIEATDWTESEVPNSVDYLIKHLEAVISISSSLLNKIGTDDALKEKRYLWSQLKAINKPVYHKINGTLVATIVRMNSKPGVWTSNRIYRVVRNFSGF